MFTLENLTEAHLRSLLTDKSLRWARTYVAEVQNPVRSGQTLTAQVFDTILYNVQIDLRPDGITAHCDCRYDLGGYCQHIGAVLLKWIQSPGSFADQEATPSPTEYPIEVIPTAPPPTHRPETPPLWMTTSFMDRQRTDAQQLARWLEGFRLQDLRQMAKQRGWKLKGTRKADVVQQVVKYITDPGDVLKASLSLDEEHRQVLRGLVLLDGHTSPGTDHLQQVATIWEELETYEQAVLYVQDLCEMGLAVPGDMADVYPPRGDFVPRAIARHLPPILERSIPATDEPPGGEGAGSPSDQATSELRLGDPYALVRTASQVMLMLEQSPSPLRPPMPRPRLERVYRGLREWDYNPHEIQKADEENLFRNPNLIVRIPPPGYSLPDEMMQRMAPMAGGAPRLEFVFSLLAAASIVQPGSPVTMWPEAKTEFLRQDELTQRAILARVYFHMSNWSALWEVLRHYPSSPLTLWRFLNHHHLTPEHLRADLVQFRQLVLRALACLPDGKWVSLEDVFHLMRTVWPRFDQTVWQPFWRPYITGSWFLTLAGENEPLSPDDTQSWLLAQGNFIGTTIVGPLHWLGLADLSLSYKDGQAHTVAIRLHGLADLYWDRVETPPAPPTAAARAPATPPEEAVQTDHHTIHVRPSAVPAQAHALLDQMARLEEATADRFVYQLDPRAAYEAFESGTALSEIIDGWEQWIPVPMPEAIQTQLTDWWEAYGRVRIYGDLTIIEFGDDYGLAEMKAVTSLEEHLIAEISPRLVIIPQQAIEALMAELDKAGYTPKQTDEV